MYLSSLRILTHTIFFTRFSRNDMAKWLEVIQPDGFIKNGGAIESIQRCTTYLRITDRSGNSKTVIYCPAGSDYVEVYYAGRLQELRDDNPYTSRGRIYQIRTNRLSDGISTIECHCKRL